jgi:hypothetical protein
MLIWEDVLLGVLGLGSGLFFIAVLAALLWALAWRRRWAESSSFLRDWAGENWYEELDA